MVGPKPNPPDFVYTVLGCVLALSLLSFNTWSGSLAPSDEVIYAMFSRSMIESGNWLDLQIDGHVFHQRPPLYPWVLSATMALFGESEWALRLPGVLFAWGTVMLMADLTRRALGSGAAIATASLLCLSGLFFVTVRRPISDSALLFFWVGTIWAWFRSRGRITDWLLVGTFAAGCMMTKQIVGMLPAAIILIDHVAVRREGVRPLLPVVVAGGVALALSSVWHIVQWVRFGSTFWSEYIGYIVVERVNTSQYRSTDSLHYLRALWRTDSVLLIGGLVSAPFFFCDQRTEYRRLRWLGVSWGILAIAPFQLSATRLDAYMLPLLPLLALFAGAGLSQLAQRLRPRVALVIGGASAAAQLVFLAPDLLRPDYAANEKILAQLLRDDALPVVALDCYPQALFWYANRDLAFWTLNPAAYEMMSDSLLLRRLHALRLVSAESLWDALSEFHGAVHVVAPCSYAQSVLGGPHSAQHVESLQSGALCSTTIRPLSP